MGKGKLISRFVLLLKGGLPMVFICLIIPLSALGEDRLIVKNGNGSATFKVEDTGLVLTSQYYNAQSVSPGFWLDETGSGNKGAFFVLDNKWMQIQRRAQGFGGYEGSLVWINIEAPASSLVIAETGYIGFGIYPIYPLQMANGAYVSAGGVWTNASSKEYKKNIKELTRDEAMGALKGLRPVKFSYKMNIEETHVGFIAEDAPDLVVTKDRKGMSSMDVVAVLTKVVQEQQRTIAELSRKVAKLENRAKIKGEPLALSYKMTPRND